MADERTCSLCEQPLDTNGYPLWCRACRTTKKRALKQAHDEMSTGRGFAAGAEVMRRELLSGLGAMAPMGMLRVKETSDWIASFPTPRPQ
jgi:cytochrome c5